MLLSRLLSLSVTALLALSATSGYALNSIYLTPVSQSALLGNTLEIDLMMDFDDPISGGGVEITFDSLLLFQSFSLDPTFTADFFPLGLPDPGETVQPIEIGFGFFAASSPLFAQRIGTLTFLAAGTGVTQMVAASASATSPGPFFSPTFPFPELVVDFSGASVDIVPVPEPSTSLLLALGLGWLSVGRQGRWSTSRTNLVQPDHRG